MYLGEGGSSEEFDPGGGGIGERDWEKPLGQMIEAMEFKGPKLEFLGRMGKALIEMGMKLPFNERQNFVREAKGLLEKRYGAEVEKLVPAEREKRVRELREATDTLKAIVSKFFLKRSR